MQPKRIPILVYHHVYPDDQAAEAGAVAGVIGVSVFTRQLAHVRTQGGQVVSTSAVIDWLREDKPLPPKAFALHFDNGWLDTFTVILPILRDLGWVATCFPITRGIVAASAGESAAVRTLTEGNVEKPFMTWQQLGELRENGWEIGGHTHTHCKAADKHAAEGDGAILEEIETSHGLFEKNLGQAPDHFAYPSGSRNAHTDALLADRYRSLRLWRWDWPIRWTFTDKSTSHLGIECQNIDARVPDADFEAIFREAPAG
jgi:peptidoglycan/xylan/chitin deacetylase (PgdA/CDA1 family)